jgi:hypothetical protein
MAILPILYAIFPMLNGKSEKRVFTKKKLMTTKKIGRLITARYLFIFISSLLSDVMDLTIATDSAELPVDEQSINSFATEIITSWHRQRKRNKKAILFSTDTRIYSDETKQFLWIIKRYCPVSICVFLWLIC